MIDRAAIRTELEAQLAQLEERGERIEAHQQNLDREVPQDWDERAVFRGNDQVVDALEQHTRRDIALIRAALLRMDKGVWGECARCGDDISEHRLQALPTALYCLACAENDRRD